LLVVKVGGRVLAENADGVARSVTELVKRGEKVLVVHGGGREIDEYARKLGIEPRYVMSPSGVRSRLTDEKELEVVLMVLGGLVNKKLVHMLNKYGARAVGLTGVDGRLVAGVKRDRIIVVDERGRKRLVDAGYTGRITSVDASALRNLLEVFDCLVFAPLVFWEGAPLNTDADYFASRVACELKADGLVYLSDVDGVMIEGELARELKVSLLDFYLEKVGPGMNRKLMHAVEAFKCGVKHVVIASGLVENPVERALEGRGSVLVGEPQERVGG